MRKFEIVYIMIFLQVGVIMTGLIQIDTSRYLGAVLIDQLFMNQIDTAFSSINYIFGTFYGLSSGTSFTTQEFKFCVPTTSICTDAIDILSFTPFVFFGQVVNLGMSCFMVPIAFMLYATIFAAPFYTTILYMLLPAGIQSYYYAQVIGYFLAAIQIIIILSDVVRSIKGVTVATIGFFLDVDDGSTAQRLGLNKRR
jgi:hypothetical protein